MFFYLKNKFSKFRLLLLADVLGIFTDQCESNNAYDSTNPVSDKAAITVTTTGSNNSCSSERNDPDTVSTHTAKDSNGLGGNDSGKDIKQMIDGEGGSLSLSDIGPGGTTFEQQRQVHHAPPQ